MPSGPMVITPMCGAISAEFPMCAIIMGICGINGIIIAFTLPFVVMGEPLGDE